MNPLRWWLIGYLTGDCSIDSRGRARTSSSNLKIVSRLKALLPGGWVEVRRTQKPLTLFAVQDPLLIKSVLQGRKGRLWPETEDVEELRAWLSGLLDADGCVNKRLKSGLSGEITTTNPKLLLLAIAVSWRLGMKVGISVSCFKEGRPRNKPIYHLYLRPIDSLKASIKVQNSR